MITLKKVQLSTALVMAACFTVAAHATPGKLNASGCHNSKKAGYHCHRAQAKPAASPATSKPAQPKHANGAASPASAASRPGQ